MIHIIVPVYNRSKITNKFADCLISQTYQNYNFILVDDGSTDDTVKSIKKKIKNLTVIKGDGNLWWAGGIQLGIDWLKKNIKNKSEIVLIANDDIVFDKYYLENAINIFKNTERSFLIAGYSNDEKINNLYCFNNKNGRFIQENDANFKANCFAMNSTFCQLNYLEDTGDLHTKLLPHYLADIEYSFRAIKKGYKVITDKTLKINWNTESTGIHEVKEINFFEYLKIVFTKKYSSNPIHWTCFYYLTMHKKYFFINICFFWIKFTLKFFLKLITNNQIEKIFKYFKKNRK